MAAASPVDENSNRSGLVQCFYKGKKTKRYCTLNGNKLEFFDNEKCQRKNQAPKFTVPLATCFNVNRRIDVKQRQFICLFTDDDCVQFKCDNESDTELWYKSIENIVIECRQAISKHSAESDDFRPLYEHVWDVFVRHTPIKAEKTEDLCQKYPSLLGPRRLCLTETSLVLWKVPVSNPSDQELDVVEFPRIHVSNYGVKDKMFFMRVGRWSVTGSGQLWMTTDPQEMCSKIHETLREIAEQSREARDRAKSELEPRTRSVWGSQGTTNALRDRSATEPHRDRAASVGEQKLQSHRKILEYSSPRHSFAKTLPSPPVPFGSSSSLTSPVSQSGPLPTNALHLPLAWQPDAIVHLPSPTQTLSEPVIREERPTSPRLSRGVSNPPTHHQPPCIEEEDYTTMDMKETEEGGSGDTLKFPLPYQTHTEPMMEPSLPVSATPSEDYVAMASGTESEGSAYMEMTSSRTGSEDMVLSDYAPMGQGTPPITGSADALLPPAGLWHPHMEEVRSYISDSSGYWSAGGGPIRAHSFGPRSGPKVKRPGSGDERKVLGSPAVAALSVPETDPRKRAYSLGSKSWAVRSTSLDEKHHFVSSGLCRLAESAIETYYYSKGMAPFRKISSSKAANLTPSDSGDLRGRSESFGSGSRLGPFNKRYRELHRVDSATRHHNEDLMELDFGGPSPMLGRSPSGSVASSESPCRSRTSSFGGTKTYQSSQDRPSEKFIAQYMQEHSTSVTTEESVPENTDDYALMTASQKAPQFEIGEKLAEIEITADRTNSEYTEMNWSEPSTLDVTRTRSAISPILPTVQESEKYSPLSPNYDNEQAQYTEMTFDPQPQSSSYSTMSWTTEKETPAPVGRKHSPLPTVRETAPTDPLRTRYASGPAVVQSRQSAPVNSPSQKFVAANRGILSGNEKSSDMNYVELDLKPSSSSSPRPSDTASTGSSNSARNSCDPDDSVIYVKIDPNETSKRNSRT